MNQQIEEFARQLSTIAIRNGKLRELADVHNVLVARIGSSTHEWLLKSSKPWTQPPSARATELLRELGLGQDHAIFTLESTR